MSGAGEQVVAARVKSEKKMKSMVLRRVAVAVVAALVATVVQVAPIQAQAQGDVEGLVSPDLAFTELDESVEVDVIANDDGVELFEADPVLTVTGQPNAATFTVVLDAEDGTPMLLLTPDAGWGGIARGTYRACWGDQCGSAQVEVYVGTSECTIVGTSGRDTLRGTPGNDVICALGGADVINARGGNDIVFGGKGADEINGGAGADSLYGGRGADLINGGGGDDFLYGRRGNDTLDGGNGADELHGNRGQDLLLGGDGADELYGGRNDDELRGQDGRDVLKGRKGADLLIGGANDDELYGNRGADRLRGQAGDDVLDGGRGTDELSGGSGTDTCSRGETYNGCEEIVEPPDEEDADGDGVPDAEDPDDDNDGIPDELDEFPLDPNESSDIDGDGIGDNSDPDADNDGVLNEDDDFPFDDSETVDSDGGGLGDNADPDDDDDGVFDDVDVFPNDGTEWEDTDGDGIGDNADTDDDNDGVPDVDDAFPKDPTETKDSDFDGIGDNADDDDDNDGVPDADDAFPTDSLVSLDTDGDGIGDLLDDDNDGDGVNDFADAFPNDPGEQFDTDLDGVGNNADTDDDDDTFLDDVDAFPLDPDEWEDLNGNGVGDNQDAVNDLDGDGIPDVDDPDIDGDLVDNGDDAFPRDPTEWSDLDGDGIGDNTDSDDDGDGVEDAEDLLPNDPNAGVDSDLDGTPDAFDAAPDDATDPRFMVETEEPSGAATEIISDSLILPEEVVITEVAVEQDDPIETVAASEIVDFEIEGPVTEFTTARITIPIDPVLAQQPDPVEVWWLNEEYGLWVPDGTDLQVDAANATVSVTVDHFSKFIALRKGATPALVPAANYLCASTGVDVVFVVDASGSTEFSYLEGGLLVDASDPLSEFTLTKRELQIQSLVNTLVGGRDRVALVALGGASESADFSSGEGGTFNIAAEVRKLIENPQSGSSISGALDEAYRILTGGEGSSRAGAVVVVSDGGFDNLPDLRRFLSADIAVHAMSVGGGTDDASLGTLAFEGGGVSVPFPAAGSTELDALAARISESAFVDDSDEDRDLLTNCEETEGVPLVDGIVWASDVADLNDAEHNSEHWLKTSALNHDSDGDLLWDSEEMVAIDIAAVDFLSEPYRLMLDAGFTRVYTLRGDPNDPNSPFVDSAVADPAAPGGRGEILEGYAPDRGSVALQNRKVSRLADVSSLLAEILESDDHPQAAQEPDLVVERAALRWAVGESDVFGLLERSIFDQRPAAELTNLSAREAMPEAWNEFDRLQLLFGDEAGVLNRLANIDAVELALIAEIETLENLRQMSSLSDQQVRSYDHRRLELTRELMGSLQRFTRFRSRFAPGTIDQAVALLEQLRSNYYYRLDPSDAGSRAVSMDVATAYRLVKMFYQNSFVRDPEGGFQTELDSRIGALEQVLKIENGVATADFDGLVRRLADQGQEFTRTDFEQLTLEALAGGREQFDRSIEVNRPRTPFLTDDQEIAVEFLREQFAFGGSADLLTVQFEGQDGFAGNRPPEVPLDGAPRGLLWRDFVEILDLAQEPGPLGEPARLTAAQGGHVVSLFDDIARSDLLDDGWREKEQFGNGQDRDPNNWRSLSVRDFGDQAFNGVAERVFLSASYELHPGMITERDMARFDVFLLARELLATRSSVIDGINSDGEVDGIINAEDVEAFLDIFRDIDNISRTEAEFIIRVARGEGLVDNNFDLNDIVNILGWLGLGFTVAGGIVVLSGGSAALASSLFAAGAAAEIPVVPIKLYQGDLKGAGIASLLILVDGNQIADAFRRTVERATPALKIVKLNSRLQDLGSDFAEHGFAEVSEAIARRASGAVGSPGADLAYARVKMLRELELDFRPLAATDQQAEFLAKRYFDDLVSRLADTTSYDEALAFFDANPGAADAYVRWGNKVFDPVEGPGLIEFVNNCRALCDIKIDSAGALKLSSVDAALDSADAVRVAAMLMSLTDDETIKFGAVLAQSWVDASRGATIARNASLDTVPGLTTKEATDKSLAATKAALAQRADVSDAALGNSQYLAHFTEDYDWLVNTFEWRSYLLRIDPPAGPVLPGETRVPSWYESPEGLIYRGPDPNAAFDTRVDHVLDHTRRRVRNVPHGVFETASPFETVDEAFRTGGLNQNVQLVDPDIDPTGVGFTIPANALNPNGQFSRVFCVRVGGTVDQIRTAFPIAC